MEKCSDPTLVCKYYGTEQCQMTVHHLYYPHKLYKTIVEKAFRELPINKIRLPRCEHDQIELEGPPPKPNEEYMEAMVRIGSYAVFNDDSRLCE